MVHEMIYTHFFNLLASLLVLVGAIAAGLWCGPLLLSLGAWLHLDLETALWRWGAGIAVAVLVCTLAVSPAWLLADWLYLNAVRRTRASWRDVRQLAGLFRVNREFTWFPVREIDDLPQAERLPYLYAFLARMQAQGLIKPRRP